MKKTPVTTTTHELAPLITELRGLIHSARHAVVTTVNTLQVMTDKVMQTPSAQSGKPQFTPSWSHYVLLHTIKNHEERNFYEIEAFQSDWSFRELKRQVASRLYERLSLSRDKEGVRQLADEGQLIVKDLKLDKLSHQDLGQMQMYVNYFDRFVKTPDENPTIGILLCKRKKEAIVELTLPADANIHAREYQLYLPSKELLRQKLTDWVREQETVYRP